MEKRQKDGYKMNKAIDHRRYEKGKVFCNEFCNYKEQVKCGGFAPFIRGGGCTFRCSGNRCRLNELIPERQTTMVYLVGRLEPVGCKVLLEVDGIFDDYKRAVEHCKTVKHFIGPLPLNKTMPTEGVAWAGMHYPKRREGSFTNEKQSEDMLI